MIQKKNIKKEDVLVIDYYIGNHLSIINALEFLGYSYKVSNSVADIKDADCYILPGVGAFNEAMTNLEKLDIIKTLKEEVIVKKKPLLGICLGMQVLADDSKEKGNHKGLGWINGHVVRIDKDMDVRVPHVGWNNIKIIKKDPLFSRIQDNSPNFYFDHSYHFVCDKRFIAATCDYGMEIIAAIQKDNIFGVQFHPEKSQNNGLRLYRSFLNYVKSKRDN